ncbi:hypothetical protein V501_05136 [Pseudogymnoascus sp. VKM F-4519 (FW-2642)]|nr:hypothetical protein V501_05136 [Pseudogymnoascus sp. VKM F-4519 (FW-2642)]
MSTSTSSSYVFPSEQWSTPATASDAHDELASDNDDLDSLPSSIDSSDESSEYSSDAQKEWEASLQQIELLLTMVVVPLGEIHGMDAKEVDMGHIAAIEDIKKGLDTKAMATERDYAKALETAIETATANYTNAVEVAKAEGKYTATLLEVDSNHAAALSEVEVKLAGATCQVLELEAAIKKKSTMEAFSHCHSYSVVTYTVHHRRVYRHFPNSRPPAHGIAFKPRPFPQCQKQSAASKLSKSQCHVVFEVFKTPSTCINDGRFDEEFFAQRGLEEVRVFNLEQVLTILTMMDKDILIPTIEGTLPHRAYRMGSDSRLLNDGEKNAFLKLARESLAVLGTS